MKTIFTGFILAAALAVPARAANLTAVSAGTYDINGTPRVTFTSGERISLRQAISVTAAGLGDVLFKFVVERPDGTTLTHTGNQVPGTAGGAQSQISLSISAFYTVPGQYKFRAQAVQGSETLSQPPAPFTISSPNITIIYPPYGARGLGDNPLVFRWVGSGASLYRVTVADNAGLYNPVHSGTAAGASLYTYPQNPTRPREQLVPDEVYFWKVEGLDDVGNVISESSVYNFTLRPQVSNQTRNITITSLELSSPALDLTKPLNFKAVLRNNGSTAESNFYVRLSLSGIDAQDSPRQVASLNAGESRELPFTAFMPAGQDEGLAVACTDLFDDNVADNCKTRLISRNSGAPSAAAPPKKLSYDEMFQAILARLGPDAAAALEGYTFESLNCANCSQGELAAVISALLSGDAQLLGAAVTDTGGAAAPSAQSPAGGGTAAAEAPAPEEELELSDLKKPAQDEWSGYTEALKASEAATFVARSGKEWKKLWSMVSADEAPEVDFGSKMVVGIISGAGDRADTVRLMGKRKTEEGVAFDYYVIEAPAGEKPQFSAYVLKVYDKEDGKVDFKRLDVGKK